MSTHVVDVILQLHDQLTGKLDAVINSTVGKFSTFDDRLRAATLGTQRIGQDAAMVTAGLGLMMAHPIKAFADMEEASLRLKSAMMQEGGILDDGLYKKLEGEGRRLGTLFPGATKDMLQTFYTLMINGVKAEQVLHGLGEATVQFGVVSHQAYTDAAQMFARLSNTMGIAESDYLAFADVLQRGFHMGASAEELRYAVGRSSGALKAMGLQGLEAAKAVVGLDTLLIRMGLTGEVVGTNTASMFNQMMDPEKVGKANDELSKYGQTLEFIDKKTGSFIGIEGMIAQWDKLKGLTDEQRYSVFRSLFGGGMDQQIAQTLAKQGSEGYHKIFEEMNRQADLNARNQKMIEGTGRMWETLTGTFTDLETEVVATFASDLKNLMTTLTEGTVALREWVAEHAGFVRAIAIGIGAFTAMTATIAAIFVPLSLALRMFSALSSALTFMGTSLGWVQAATKGATAVSAVGAAAQASAANVGLLSRAMRLLVGATPAGFALRVAALIGIDFIWDKYGESISSFFSGITDAFNKQTKTMQGEWRSTLTNAFDNIWNSVFGHKDMGPKFELEGPQINTNFRKGEDIGTWLATQAKKIDQHFYYINRNGGMDFYLKDYAARIKNFVSIANTYWANLFKDSIPAIKTFVSTANTYWSNLFKDAYQGSAIERLISTLQDGAGKVRAFFTDMRQSAVDSYEWIMSGTLRVVDTLTAFITSARNMASEISDAMSRVKASVFETMGALASAIEQGANKIYQGFSGIGSKLKGILEGLVPMAMSTTQGWGTIGTSMGNNLARGFQASLGAVRASMNSLATMPAIKAPAIRVEHIQGPARTMMRAPMTSTRNISPTVTNTPMLRTEHNFSGAFKPIQTGVPVAHPRTVPQSLVKVNGRPTGSTTNHFNANIRVDSGDADVETRVKTALLEWQRNMSRQRRYDLGYVI